MLVQLQSWTQIKKGRKIHLAALLIYTVFMNEKTQIVLTALEGNDATHLKGMQVYLAPHIDTLIFMWWMVMMATVVYLVGTYIVIPLINNAKHQ